MSMVEAHRSVRGLRMREFRLLRDRIYAEAGIHLPDAKRVLIEARLSRRLRELGMRSYEEYCAYLQRPHNASELVPLLDCITTHETHFFREPKHFDFLQREVLPRWAHEAQARNAPRRVRAWSAACSSGEEAYTLGMCLLDAFGAEPGWDLQVLASDLSTRVLARAEAATWSIEKLGEIPERALKRYMLRGVGDHVGQLRAGPELRSLVRFSRVNLNRPPYPVPGDLDLIFCRNVLIYFDAASRARVIDALVDRLAPSGYLFVGHSESLHNVTRRLRLVAPSVYVRREPELDARDAEGQAR